MNNDMEFSFLQLIQFYVFPTASEYFYFALCHWKVIKLDKDIFMYFFFFFCGNKELSLAEQQNNSEEGGISIRLLLKCNRCYAHAVILFSFVGESPGKITRYIQVLC